MKSAVRRTGMYLYSSANWSSPRSVRAPQTTRPGAGNERRQLMPSGLSSPFSSSVSGTVKPTTLLSVAASPAGAFQTPRCASVWANIPARAPQAAKSSTRLLCSGFASRSRGKKIAALRLFVPTLSLLGSVNFVFALSFEIQSFGASIRSIARRASQ